MNINLFKNFINKNTINGNNIFILFFVILIFIILRVVMGFNHFTHYDDLYGPFLLRDIGGYSLEKMVDQLEKYGIDSKLISLYFNVFGSDFGLTFLKYIIGPIAIAKSSTFAPFQFYITGLFAWVNFDYKYTLFWIRFPSLLFSVAFVFLAIRYLKLIKVIENNSGVILFLIYPITSWMFLIYSSQAENYVIGLIFIPVMLFYLHSVNLAEYKLKHIIKINLVIFIGIFSSYQIIWFVPAFIISYLFQLNKNKLMNAGEKVISLLLFLLFLTISVISAYFIFIRKLLIERANGEMKIGIGWNAGVDNEYQYSLVANEIFVNFYNFIIFICKNLNNIIWSMSGGGDYSSVIVKFSNIVFLLLLFLGLYLSLTIRSLRYLSIFGLMAFATWLFFIASGVLAFSPTRHSLIYMSLAWIFVGIAINYIFSKKNKYKYIKILMIFSLHFIISLFVLDFHVQYNSRKNMVLKTELLEYIRKTNPSIIYTYNFTLDLNFDEYINNNYKVKFFNQNPYYFKFELKNPKNNEIMFVCLSHKDCYDANAIKKISQQQAINLSEFQHEDKSSMRSNTSTCFGNYTINGTNEIKIDIFK